MLRSSHLLLLLLTFELSRGTLVLPGAEYPPTRYTIDVYVVCDYYCYENIGAINSDREKYLYDVIYHASRIVSQLGVSLEVMRMEIWNSYGWTNWTTTSVNPEYFYNVIDRMLERPGMKRSAYIDDVLFFTGTSLTTGSTSGTSNIRGIHTTGSIGSPGSKGILMVTKAPNANLLALTVAHEIGHGLNMLHDTPSCQCPVGPSNCIMESVSTLGILAQKKFSKCSMDRFTPWIAGTNGIPLNKGLAPTSGQMSSKDSCGNGNIDAGEDCDCGPDCTANGANPCCKNCKFLSGAICADGPCCTAACQFKPLGTKCRTIRDGLCDLQDVCSGNSGKCDDKYVADWKECIDNQGASGYCRAGFCNTANVQCQVAFNPGFSSGIASCYNASNLPGEVIFTAGLSPLCQTLICNKNNSAGIVHPDRKMKTFNARGAQCTIGQYIPVERGLFGVESGLIQVDDGTRCGVSAACYDGKCLPKDQVVTAMKDQPITNRKQSYCGNGRIDSGEDCDCSPLQCPCCDVTECKFIRSNSPCLGVCGVCSGNSKECSASSNPASNFRQCSGSFDKLCYNGLCVSTLSQCQSRWFPWSRNVFQYNFRNIAVKSKLFNSGGFYVLSASGSLISEEYRAGEDDGMCGILQCSVATPDDQAPDWDTTKDPRQVFSIEMVNTGWIKVKYYNKANRTANGSLQRVFHPLLVEDGTPCFLANNVLGYCKVQTQMSSSGISYPYSKCIKI